MAARTGTGAEGRPADAGRPAHVRARHGRGGRPGGMLGRLGSGRLGRSGPAPAGHARETNDRRLGYLMVAPVVILLLAVTAYPLIYNVWNLFHFDNLSYANLPHDFVGWSNFAKMFRSAQWVAALRRTLAFTVVTVVFDMVM